MGFVPVSFLAAPWVSNEDKGSLPAGLCSSVTVMIFLFPLERAVLGTASLSHRKPSFWHPELLFPLVGRGKKRQTGEASPHQFFASTEM